MEIVFRLESLEVGKTLEHLRMPMELGRLLGESIESYEDSPVEEKVKATFVRKNADANEVLTLLLNMEEAKMYIIGHEYTVTL